MKTQLNNQVFDRFPVLETPRLLLREARLADAPMTFAIRNDTTVMRYLDTPAYESIAVAEQKIRRNLGDFADKNGINWIITNKDQNEMIGYIGFWRLIPQHLRAEIGYALHSDYWGKGFMSEAMDTVLDWAFRTYQLHSIEANVNPQNEASKQLLQRFGFQQEAYFRENYFFNGQFLDSAIFGLIASDYFQTKA